MAGAVSGFVLAGLSRSRRVPVRLVQVPGLAVPH